MENNVGSWDPGPYSVTPHSPQGCLHLSAGLQYRKLMRVREGADGSLSCSRVAELREPGRAALGTAVLREGSGAAGAERVTGAKRRCTAL